MRTLGIWFFCLALPPGLFAQKTTPDYERSYQTALQLLRANDFDKARLAFIPLTQARYTGDRVPYAHYFAALASLKGGLAFEAKTLLRQLFDRYPAWPKTSEAWYLMANACFDDDDYPTALDYLKRALDDPALRADALALEDYYLRRLGSLPILKGLYVTYPDDRLVALALMDLIQRTSTDKADLELSDRLTNRYGVRPGAVSASTQPGPNAAATSPKPSSSKGFYNVGVLFPFRVDDLDSRNRALRNTQFALDLYNGMKLAVKKLQAEGIVVNLLAYDIENDPARMQELVSNAPFRQADLLVGPLYAESNRVATAWAAGAGVPVVNPISTNPKLLENAPNVFLVQPSLDRQASEAARFSRQKWGTAPALVLYGPARADSVLAAAYAQQLRQQRVEVLALLRQTTSVSEVLARLAPQLEAKRPGHVFLASGQRTAGTALLAALSRSRLGEVPLVSTTEAFDFTTVSGNQLAGREVYWLDPNFVEKDKSDVVAFQRDYLKRYGAPPSVFAYQGYDLLLFWGRMLSKHSGNLRTGLDRQAYREGYTLGGFDYQQASDNRAVPIVRYENYQFEVVK